MAEQSYTAAEQLRRLRNHRSCISRAYYAAFSAITSAIRKRTAEFPQGFEHPPHVQVGRFVKRHLTQFKSIERDAIRNAVDRLRFARHDADYRRDADPKEDDVRKAMFDARYILETLGVL